MTRDEIDQLITAMRAHGVTDLEWAQARKGQELRLTLPDRPAAAQSQTVAAPAPPRSIARSPGLGHFVPRGAEDGLPPLASDLPVQQGDVLGYIAQGPWAQVLAAPETGRVVDPLPTPGQIFGHGDPVLTLEGTPE